MAILDVDTTHETRNRGRDSYTLDDGITFFAGGLVGTDSAGFLVKWANVVGHRFEGLLLDGDRDNNIALIGDISATPPTEGRVDTSGLIIKNATVGSLVQASVNSLVFCTTDNPADFQLATTSNVDAIGRVRRFISAGVGDVVLLTPEEHAAI